MKLWADWLADNPRDHARCPGLTQGDGQKGRKRLGYQPSRVTSGSARYRSQVSYVDLSVPCFPRLFHRDLFDDLDKSADRPMT
jgi:hypothetical protein